jgi:hypothetical protein
VIAFEFNRFRSRLQLIRTERTHRPLLLPTRSPSLQLVKLPLILSLDPEKQLLINAVGLLGLLGSALLMVLAVRHAVNHVLILCEGLFLAAPEVTLLQEGCLVGLRFLLEDLQGVVIVELEFHQGLRGV